MALTTAFARNGNRKAVPQTAQDGSVNYSDGFGAFYALPPEEGGLLSIEHNLIKLCMIQLQQ